MSEAVKVTSLKLHLFSEVWLRYAGRQDVPAELDGRGQLDECDVIVVGFRLVIIVGDYSFHIVSGFITVIHQHVELTWRHRNKSPGVKQSETTSWSTSYHHENSH